MIHKFLSFLDWLLNVKKVYASTNPIYFYVTLTINFTVALPWLFFFFLKVKWYSNQYTHRLISPPQLNLTIFQKPKLKLAFKYKWIRGKQSSLALMCFFGKHLSIFNKLLYNPPSFHFYLIILNFFFFGFHLTYYFAIIF